jgi:hypothetical protein
VTITGSGNARRVLRALHYRETRTGLSRPADFHGHVRKPASVDLDTFSTNVIPPSIKPTEGFTISTAQTIALPLYAAIYTPRSSPLDLDCLIHIWRDM